MNTDHSIAVFCHHVAPKDAWGPKLWNSLMNLRKWIIRQEVDSEYKDSLELFRVPSVYPG